jgi:hypothetical protein
MEQILAFVLGLGIGIFILVVVSAFKTVKKVKQLEKQVTDIELVISGNERAINRRVDQEIDRTDRLVGDVYSFIDSRFDKFETRITKEKQVIKG